MRRLSVSIVALVVAGVCSGPAAAMPRYEIAGLQVGLYRHGHYKGPIDGIAGPMTKRAILELQRSAGLEADGVAGKRTLTALGRYGRPAFGSRTLKRGAIGYDVSVLQYLLARRGFAPERLNSNFGSVTERLVRQFQRKVGLAADGVVGEQTRAALVAQRPAKRHVVRPGETLSAIAARHGTNVRRLAQRNRLDPGRVLLAGVTLVVPDRIPGQRAAVTSALDRWAAHYGVDPRLARALAWQESGFQSDVRSSAGAVGVMQVTAATWSFVEEVLLGRRVPRTTSGNVRVGVAYLNHLLREFKGDVRLAVGAYYQGTASVRRRGLAPETQRFVANVLALRGRV